jgi:XTP/dITP diphosphohydrolase
MPQLLVATNNEGKLAELRRLISGCGWELVVPRDLGLRLEVEEVGASYEENARLKAEAGAAASGLVTLADDSGLEIEALGGEPGVHSAVFLGPEATYAERFAEIYRRLEGTPFEERRARFVAVIAVAEPAPRGERPAVHFARGEVRGLIAPAPRGEHGFGYDPIFWVPQHSATMAELPEHEKDIISHRGRAAALARQILKELLHVYGPRDSSHSRR